MATQQPDTQYIPHGEEIRQIIQLAQSIKDGEGSKDVLGGVSREIVDAVKEASYFMRDYPEVIGATVLETAKKLMEFGVFDSKDIRDLERVMVH